MKSKTLEMSDYPAIRNEVRSLMRAQAEFAGAGYTFNVPHNHRYWEYGSGLAALHEAEIKPPVRILDVGCGHGPFGPWLAKLGYQVDEIDPSVHVAGRADLRPAMEGLDWAFAGVSLANFKTASPYEAVFAISTMEHIPPAEQQQAWEQLASLVAPGGLLFATVDFGKPEATNKTAREMIFGEETTRATCGYLIELGFTFEDFDPIYHGDQVFDYTFLRLIARKAP